MSEPTQDDRPASAATPSATGSPATTAASAGTTGTSPGSPATPASGGAGGGPKLRAPEPTEIGTDQFDQLMELTRPPVWLAVLTCLLVIVGLGVWGVRGSAETRVAMNGVALRGGSLQAVVAPLPSVVAIVHVTGGQTVAAGDPLVTLETGGPDAPTPIQVNAREPGEVLAVLTAPGEAAGAGQVLLRLGNPNAPVEVLGFAPLGVGEQIQPGMTARFQPSASGIQVDLAEGVVASVSPVPYSSEDVGVAIGDTSLADVLTNGETTIPLRLSFAAGAGLTGGSPDSIPIVATGEVTVVTGDVAPIELLGGNA